MIKKLNQTDCVGFEIKRLAILIKREIDNCIAQKCPEKPTGVHGFVINYLFKNKDKDIFQKDLEEEFSIRRSTATSILKLMEKNNYITRTTTEYDARLKKIELTEKAITFHQIISSEIKRIEQNLTAGLSEEEIRQFFLIANKMRHNIENSNE